MNTLEPVPTGKYEMRGIVVDDDMCLWAADLGRTPEMYGLYAEVLHPDGDHLYQWLADYPTDVEALAVLLALTTGAMSLDELSGADE